MTYTWSATAGRYVPVLAANRRYFTNTGYLISLGVSEWEITGQEDASGVSWETRYAMLLPRRDRSVIVHRAAATLTGQGLSAAAMSTPGRGKDMAYAGTGIALSAPGGTTGGVVPLTPGVPQ